jgi:hypothetical protein
MPLRVASGASNAASRKAGISTKQIPINHDPLDFIEADLIQPAIVELVVRVDAWCAIAAAFSSVPPFLRYAVIRSPGNCDCVASFGCRPHPPAGSSRTRSPAAARCGSAFRCRARSCGTAAPWDHAAGLPCRDKLLGIPRCCDDTAWRATCRPFRATAPKGGGSVCIQYLGPSRHMHSPRSSPNGAIAGSLL